MTPTEALTALDALYRSCRRCANHRVNLIRAISDRRQVAHKAAHEAGERDWSRLLDKAERELASAIEHTEAHLAEPHEAPAPKRARPTAPAPVEDARPECPRCGTRVALNSRGRLGAHRGPSGLPCPRRLLAVDIELPPVNLPATPKRSVPTAPRDPQQPSRLDAGSNCEDCGRWLPGERILCGRCFNHRARAG